MTALLKVTDLKKAYGAIQAVGGVSFEVQPGEIFGVIGPNGSGKTTLFNSMLGQITPNAGTIELKGEDVTHCGPLELSRRGVGRTFQTLQVFGKMTVRDNLIVAAQEHHGSMLSRMFAPGDSGLGAKADALIDRFRIRHVAHLKAGTLSYGQQKLVDIGRALRWRQPQPGGWHLYAAQRPEPQPGVGQEEQLCRDRTQHGLRDGPVPPHHGDGGGPRDGRGHPCGDPRQQAGAGRLPGSMT
jgi:ABC-type branched-subunit amino acid transport system ATPase component